MGAAVAVMDGAGASADGERGKKAGGKKRLALLLLPVLLAGTGGGLWFTGVLPNLLGLNKHEAEAKEAVRAAPVFVELPEMVANLNAGSRRNSFIKLKSRLELAKAADMPAFTEAQPRIVDLFQTYLREVRPEELRGSAGTYRLREELIARANIAAAPAHIVDVLFTEMLVQ